MMNEYASTVTAHEVWLSICVPYKVNLLADPQLLILSCSFNRWSVFDFLTRIF